MYLGPDTASLPVRIIVQTVQYPIVTDFMGTNVVSSIWTLEGPTSRDSGRPVPHCRDPVQPFAAASLELAEIRRLRAVAGLDEWNGKVRR